MKLTPTFRGTNAPFEGDRTFFLRGLPADAKITRASATVSPSPINTSEQPGPFLERIRLFDGQGDWGATSSSGSSVSNNSSSSWVEVDFHNRRTLHEVVGSPPNAADGMHLQVDMGGAWVNVNMAGALTPPQEDNDLFSVDLTSRASLPGITSLRFRLNASGDDNPAVSSFSISEVIIRSVPTNVTLGFDQLPPFWTKVGDLIDEQQVPDFTEAFQLFLDSAEVENGFYVIPIRIHSDLIARLDIQFDIEFVQEVSVFREELTEVNLPYGFDSVPQAQKDLLKVTIPADSRIVPGGTSGSVKGAFQESRVVFGNTGHVTASVLATVTGTTSQAQPFMVQAETPITAIDLLLASVSREATVEVNILPDSDGKPFDDPLLDRPVTFQLNRDTAGTLTWLSANLSNEFLFRPDSLEEPGQPVRYWLVVHAVNGEVAWGSDPMDQAPPGLQFSESQGIAWRETVDTEIEGPFAAHFRLRHTPAVFSMPIELEVGEGDTAQRVSLERFQPLGRIDFTLDFEEVAGAFNNVLEVSAGSTCPEVELLSNGDMEEWITTGEDLFVTGHINVPNHFPELIVASPDNKYLYVATTRSTDSFSERDAFLLKIDRLQCRLVDQLLIHEAASSVGAEITAFTISPDGSQAYIISEADSSLQFSFVDLATFTIRGTPSLPDQQISIRSIITNTDGTFLYIPLEDRNGVSSIIRVDTQAQTLNPFDNTTLEFETITTLNLISSRIHAIQRVPNQAALVMLASSAVTESGENTFGVLHLFRFDDIENKDVSTINRTMQIELYRTQEDEFFSTSLIEVDSTGEQAIVSVPRQGRIYFVDLLERQSSHIELNAIPRGLKLSPDDRTLFFGLSTDITSHLVAFDIDRQSTISMVDVENSLNSIEQTQIHGDIYITKPDTSSLQLHRQGPLQPEHWSILSGRVHPFLIRNLGKCYTALLGSPLATTDQFIPSVLSQVFPVVPECAYKLGIDGRAMLEGARVEVRWIGDVCGEPVAIESFPIQPFNQSTSGQFTGISSRPFNQFGSFRRPFRRKGFTGFLEKDVDDHGTPDDPSDDTQVILNQNTGLIKFESLLGVSGLQREILEAQTHYLVAPAGITQAEIRVIVSPSNVAFIDNISFQGTTNVVQNSQLALPDSSDTALQLPEGWTLTPEEVTSVTFQSVTEGVQINNRSRETIELSQTATIKPNQPSTLIFDGSPLQSTPSAEHPSIILNWMDSGENLLAQENKLMITLGQEEPFQLRETTPAESHAVRTRLLIPPGQTLLVRNVVFQLLETVEVPFSFISQSPGSVTLTDFQVSVEEIVASRPPVPPQGLCVPAVDNLKDDECYCQKCGTGVSPKGNRTFSSASALRATVGFCPNCSTDLIQLGGQPVAGASTLSVQTAIELNLAQRPAGRGTSTPLNIISGSRSEEALPSKDRLELLNKDIAQELENLTSDLATLDPKILEQEIILEAASEEVVEPQSPTTDSSKDEDKTNVEQIKRLAQEIDALLDESPLNLIKNYKLSTIDSYSLDRLKEVILKKLDKTA